MYTWKKFNHPTKDLKNIMILKICKTRLLWNYLFVPNLFVHFQFENASHNIWKSVFQKPHAIHLQTSGVQIYLRQIFIQKGIMWDLYESIILFQRGKQCEQLQTNLGKIVWLSSTSWVFCKTVGNTLFFGCCFPFFSSPSFLPFLPLLLISLASPPPKKKQKGWGPEL